MSSRTATAVLAGAVLAGALASTDARAGACCAGATSTLPTRLGECERVAATVDVDGEDALARWDSSGDVARTSAGERMVTTTFGAGYRWSRKAQVGVAVPVLATWRTTGGGGGGSLADTGYGIGDVSFGFVVDPFEEMPAGMDGSTPVPVLSLGGRLPTGRDWKHADGPLLADVTGLPDASFKAGLALERALGRTPWQVGIDADVPLGDTPAVYGASFGVGRYVGTDWSVGGGVRYQLSPAGSSRTTASLRVVHGRRLAWRSWAGLSAGLPIDELGRDNPIELHVDAGVALVR